MRYLFGEEIKEAQEFISLAIEVAMNATCERDKCGSVVVKNNAVIGEGFNSPPKNLESQRRCGKDKNLLHKRITDKTCCIHAEQRAIVDALIKNFDKILDSKLYFVRLDKSNQMTFSGKPYCTICSKLALDVGIKEFVLVHEEGICVYDTEEYNLLSYEYKD